MHGVIHLELKKFVISLGGDALWLELLKAAGLPTGRLYSGTKSYPDEEAVAVVQAACAKTGKSAPEILEAFGQFIVPDLLGTYGTLIKPQWRTLDVVENTETAVHQVLRFQDANAKPAQLEARRLSPTELELTYRSPRNLFPVAIGIAKGVAAHFGESLSVQVLKDQPGESIMRLKVG